MQESTIASQFKSDDSARFEILERARLCAALTKPWILPPQGHQSNSELPENYQAIGSRGLTNLEGRMLLALFPPEQPWYRLEMAPDIKYDPDVPVELKQQMEQRLGLYELQIQSTLESANLHESRGRRRAGFRSRKRMALTQVLATGDALEQLTDDFRLKTFRRDQYVTRRDSAGDVLYHIVKERIDPMSLPDEQRVKAELGQQVYEARTATERMQDLYTHCEWQPDSKTWLIEQEMNGRVINTSEEKISPFFSTPFELAPEEDYGRGYIELNLGDLRSLNELEQRILEFAAIHSKNLWAIDYGSQVRDRDLAQPSGGFLKARVTGGQVQDVAALGPNNATNFNITYQAAERKTKDLGAAMLMESALQPQKERVTALQVQRIAMELEGALGGVYAPIADEQQIPLLQRTVYVMEKQGLLPKLPNEAVQIKALTGIAALGREIDAARLMDLTTVIAQLGETAMRKIDLGVLVDVMARYRGIHEAGLIKSNEQVQAELQQAMQLQLAQQAGEQAIQTAGNVAEAQATQGGSQQ